MFDYKTASKLMANNKVNFNSGKYFVVIPLPLKKRNNIKPGYYVARLQHDIIVMKYLCPFENQKTYKEKKVKQIIVKVSKTLRFTIPKELRAGYNIKGSILIGYNSDSEEIYISPYITTCVFCDSHLNLHEFGKWKICEDCINDIMTLFGGSSKKE